MNTSAARSLVLYYVNGSDNKGKQNNISRVKVSVSRPLWRAQADGPPCQGRLLVREWTASGVLCAAPRSLWRLQKCSGRPLTHAAINYCLLLSSVLNKGRDADKKCHPCACNYNQLRCITKLIYCWWWLCVQEYSTDCVHCWKILKILLSDNWCLEVVVGVFVSEDRKSVV